MSLLQIITNTINSFSFDHQTFAQIIQIFNIPIDNIYEPNLISILHQKLKSKLNNIFLSQGKNYQDYLRLPKFSALKPQTQLKLTMLLDQIWRHHQTQMTKSNQNNYSQIISYMLPHFKSLNQIETFHLEMFTQFKNNKFSKQIYPQQFKNIMQPPTQNNYPLPPIDPMLSGFHRPNVNPGMPPSSFYPKMDNEFINSNSNMMGRMFPNTRMNNPWMQQQHSQHTNIIQPAHLSSGNVNNSPFPIPHISQSNRSFFPIPQQHNYNIERDHNFPLPFKKPSIPPINISSSVENQYRKDQSSIEEQRQQEQSSKLVHITGQDDEFQQKIKQYQFIQCACEGNFKSSSYFQCKLCHFYFHHECLNMTEKLSVQICPCCKLRQGTNIFIKIHPQVFGKRWCKMHIRQKLSMFLTQREIEKMRAIKQGIKPNSVLQYQLRFLKIPNKQLNPLNINNSQNNSFNRKSYNNMNNNNDTRKFNNLPLPSGYIQKIQPYDVFEISLKPEMKNSNRIQEQQSLYIFGIFMIEKYSQMSITQDLFQNLNQQNTVGEEFLEKYLIDSQEGLEIKLMDPTSQQPIRYPVRGQQCNHPQVFDCMSILQYYKQYGEKLTQMHCPVCQGEFKKMIVDRFLYQKLRQNQAQGDQQERLRYYGGGRVQFVSDQQQLSEKSVNQNNQNDQQNENNMDEQQKQFNSDNNDQDNSQEQDSDNEESPSLSC